MSSLKRVPRCGKQFVRGALQFAHPALWVGSMAAAIGAYAAPDLGHGTGGSGGHSNPCGIAMEILCDQTPPAKGKADGTTLGIPCDCGEGVWVRSLPVFQGTPAQPISEINVPVHINGTNWAATREAVAQPGYADVHVAGYGASHFWRAGSLARSVAARYSVVSRELWQGTGIPCPRLVTLAASGGGGLTLTLTCSAAQGCGASGASSISGSCSSLGNASASIDNKRVDGTVAYDSASESTEISGRFGTLVDDSSMSVEGRISQSARWSVEGAGNVSGTASYTVKEDRNYCAFTNRPITRTSVGVAVCAAGATVDDNGSAAFDARAFVALTVN
jgi:hypothetical protein